MRKTLILTVGALAAALIFGQAWAIHVGGEGTETVEQTAAAKAAFERTCSKCHGTDRPLGKVKDPEGWRSTVERMSGKHEAKFGKPIPTEDKDAIVLYLIKVAGKPSQ